MHETVFALIYRDEQSFVRPMRFVGASCTWVKAIGQRLRARVV